ncbi:MAG TPA: DUF2207 domain-containing protein, partial [Candidatus Saccharimonadales bacterium]|nr:DUF2207 domain-containing protein [Candidatus Saccharimonadales bacterium]
MRRLLFLPALLTLLVLFGGSVKAGPQDFVISRFSADYYLARDEKNVSRMRVHEEIVAEFPDSDQNHGILRAIPQQYDGHSLELDVAGVKDQTGKSLPYDTYSESGNMVLRIGDPDQYVHGRQEYRIEYTMRGVIHMLSDHDELYWDVNGDQWFQSIAAVEARVHIPQDLAPHVLEQKSCFAGYSSSKDQDCTVAYKANGDAVATITATKPLDPNQTLTFVLGFSKNNFAPYAPSDALIRQWVLLGVAIAAPPLIALAFAVRNWRKYGRDPEGKGTIVPEYLPPKQVSVLQSGMVLSERFEVKVISAQLIDLAVRHFVKVYEIKSKQVLGHKTEYQLELVGDFTKLLPEEQDVLKMVFTELHVGAKTVMSKTSGSLAAESTKLGARIALQLEHTGYFRIDPNKARAPYIIGGVVVGAAGFFFLPWGWGFVAAGLVLGLSSIGMPARTAKGVALREHLLGLKMYMQLAEADRLTVLQSPHGRLTQKIDTGDNRQLVKLYERLLPYAMLFGIEKEWAKQFAHLYKEEPQWYHGSGVFNAVVFAGAVSSFSSATTASFTASTSSSGSG